MLYQCLSKAGSIFHQLSSPQRVKWKLLCGVWPLHLPGSCGRAQHSPGGNAALPHGGFSLQRHLVLWMNHVTPSLLCAATTALNLSSPKTEKMRFVRLLRARRGRKAPSLFFFNIFYFILFYLEGEEKEGWHRVGAGDVIKAPAEEICGSGVSTSEKSMAAAVAAPAVPQGSRCRNVAEPAALPSVLLPAPFGACSLPADQTHLDLLSWIRTVAYFCNQSKISRVAPSPSSCQPPLRKLPSLQCSLSQQLLPVCLEPAWKNELFSFFFEQGNCTNLSGVFQSPS